MNGEPTFLVGWMYEENGDLVGPVNAEQLAALTANDRLRLSDVIWEAWREGESVRLFPSHVRVALATCYPEEAWLVARGEDALYRAKALGHAIAERTRRAVAEPGDKPAPA
jgi:hypothetical protein